MRRGDLGASANVAASPATARQGRRPAELTHRFFPIMRDLLGEALPLVTVVRFDSPRPKPRPWLRCSDASKGRQGRTQAGAGYRSANFLFSMPGRRATAIT